jgi:multicomponent Na+:H+ antiporter subunit C
MLTAIVVAVVTLGVSFALLVAIYRRYQTLDEPLLLEKMR